MNMLIRFFLLMNLVKHEQSKNKTITDSLSQDVLFKPFTHEHRILPHDMGFRNHLPNYRYLSFIELNIAGWLYGLLKQKGLNYAWLISMQEVVYLKQVKLFDKMTVSSRLEGWDEKYIYFQHHFYVKDTLMAIGLTKFILANKKGKQSPEVLDMQGEHLTEVITTWNTNQQAVKNQMT